MRVASRTAWSSFAFAALDFANQCEPVLMCTPAMRDASVIDEPAAMAAKKRALSSGGTLLLVPISCFYLRPLRRFFCTICLYVSVPPYEGLVG